MQGLARLSGDIYREIHVAGRTWKLSPPRLRDMAKLEAALLAALPDPIQQAAAAAANVPANQVERFWEAAFAAAAQVRRYSISQLDQLPTSLQTAAAAFLALQRWHSEQITTLQEALDWCDHALAEHGERLESILTAAVQEASLATQGEPSPNPPTSP